ncbi:MAG: cytochrome C biogenesis protein [Planctomycetes bacterium]|nr:cytochrome C biogenesis protein [Planctomycetota bacterium]
MTALVTAFTDALEGSLVLAVAAALVWGVLSIVLSPCHLASIGLAAGFLGIYDAAPRARAATLAAVFAVGILVTIAGAGALTVAAGRIAGDLGPWPNYIVAIVFAAVGLYLLDVITLPDFGRRFDGLRRHGLASAFVLGVLFGTALGPCAFAFMAPMLGIVFKWAGTDTERAVAVVAAFGLGHCAAIVIGTTSIHRVQDALRWSANARAAKWTRASLGVALIATGLWFFWSAP